MYSYDRRTAANQMSTQTLERRVDSLKKVIEDGDPLKIRSAIKAIETELNSLQRKTKTAADEADMKLIGKALNSVKRRFPGMRSDHSKFPRITVTMKGAKPLELFVRGNGVKFPALSSPNKRRSLKEEVVPFDEKKLADRMKKQMEGSIGKTAEWDDSES